MSVGGPGIWSADVIGGDSALELAMRLLAAAEIAPQYSRAGEASEDRPGSLSIVLLPSQPGGAGVRPLITRHVGEEYDAWSKTLDLPLKSENAQKTERNFAFMVQEANLIFANKSPWIQDCGAPAGHAYHVLMVLVMWTGARYHSQPHSHTAAVATRRRAAFLLITGGLPSTKKSVPALDSMLPTHCQT